MKSTVGVFFTIIVLHVQAFVPLSELNFPEDALEPYFDTMTMNLHHTKHYAGQVRGVNKALEECGIQVDSYRQLAQTILPLIGTDNVPKECPETWPSLVRAVRNSGGGAFNHHLFWSILTPLDKSNMNDVSEVFRTEVESKWGSMEGFKEEFTKAALSVFGSGWAWLVLGSEGLEIMTTANQDNPLMSLESVYCSNNTPGEKYSCEEQKGWGKCWESFMVPQGNCLQTCDACSYSNDVIPLLNIDMWEHSYYLKYNNRRAEYVNAFWNVVNWAEVDSLFSQSF